MAARRWLLLSLAILSMVLFVLGGLSLAYSARIGDDAADAARLPGDEGPLHGTRVLAIPIEDPKTLPTLANHAGTDALHQRDGALLVTADDAGDLPASAHNVTLVRALAYVAPAGNGTYAPATVRLQNLTRVEGGNVTTYEQTVDVAPLALGKAGYLVKADAEGAIRFVPAERVMGEARAFLETSDVIWLLAITGAGFLGPVLWLIMTHGPSGTKGVPGGVPGVMGGCPECRAPLPPGADFCTRCGAWVKERPKP